MNECASISSNDEDDEVNADDVDVDDVEDEANQLGDDGLSDFDNFSGRDTPIISGRDTPSSHSHEDLQNTSGSTRPGQASATGAGAGVGGGGVGVSGGGGAGGVGVGGGGVSGANGQAGPGIGGVTGTGPGVLGAFNSPAGGGGHGGHGLHSNSNVVVPRGPQLPVTIQKANREDINDKFCKFEINKSSKHFFFCFCFQGLK